MGYTHHWRLGDDVDATAFASAVADCEALAAAAGIPLAGLSGTGLPRFDDACLELNGAEPEHCEPLIVRLPESGPPRRFCKTNWRPYDLVVAACLIAFAHHVPGFHPGSDGGNEEWAPARDLCERVLGYGSGFVLSE